MRGPARFCQLHRPRPRALARRRRGWRSSRLTPSASVSVDARPDSAACLELDHSRLGRALSSRWVSLAARRRLGAHTARGRFLVHELAPPACAARDRAPPPPSLRRIAREDHLFAPALRAGWPRWSVQGEHPRPSPRPARSSALAAAPSGLLPRPRRPPRRRRPRATLLRRPGRRHRRRYRVTPPPPAVDLASARQRSPSAPYLAAPTCRARQIGVLRLLAPLAFLVGRCASVPYIPTSAPAPLRHHRPHPSTRHAPPPGRRGCSLAWRIGGAEPSPRACSPAPSRETDLAYVAPRDRGPRVATARYSARLLGVRACALPGRSACQGQHLRAAPRRALGGTRRGRRVRLRREVRAAPGRHAVNALAQVQLPTYAASERADPHSRRRHRRHADALAVGPRHPRRARRPARDHPFFHDACWLGRAGESRPRRRQHAGRRAPRRAALLAAPGPGPRRHRPLGAFCAGPPSPWASPSLPTTAAPRLSRPGRAASPPSRWSRGVVAWADRHLGRPLLLARRPAHRRRRRAVAAA